MECSILYLAHDIHSRRRLPIETRIPSQSPKHAARVTLSHPSIENRQKWMIPSQRSNNVMFMCNCARHDEHKCSIDQGPLPGLWFQVSLPRKVSREESLDNIHLLRAAEAP